MRQFFLAAFTVLLIACYYLRSNYLLFNTNFLLTFSLRLSSFLLPQSFIPLSLFYNNKIAINCITYLTRLHILGFLLFTDCNRWIDEVSCGFGLNCIQLNGPKHLNSFSIINIIYVVSITPHLSVSFSASLFFCLIFYSIYSINFTFLLLFVYHVFYFSSTRRTYQARM